MLNHWSDSGIWGARVVPNDLLREMSHLFREFEEGEVADGSARALQVATRDAGDTFVVNACVPGMADADVEITLQGDSLVVRGKRNVDVPEGYRALRRERTELEFVRSFSLPAHVEVDSVKAGISNGVLTIELPKAAEEQPKRISVQAA